jgi:hypothetical protein
MRRLIHLFLLSALLLVAAGPAGSQDRGDDDLLDELESILREEKRKPNYDKDLVRKLEALLRKHRARAGGGAADEGGDPGGGGRSRGGGGRGGGGGFWSPEAVIGRIVDGLEVELDPAEREVVTRILVEFWTSRQLVLSNDHMESYPDIERDRNNRLGHAVGARKAKEIVDAVDQLIDRWSRWGNRGGRGGGGRGGR